MVFGELNLNYDASTGGLFYKNSAGTVVKVGPAQVGTTAPNATPAGSSGNSAGEFWYDTAVSTLKVYNGTAWVATAGSGSVVGVTGTAPITVNNTDPTNPVIGVSAGTTSAAGVLQLTDSYTSFSTTTAATPNAVQQVYNLAYGALQRTGGTMSGTIQIGSSLADTGGSVGQTGYYLATYQTGVEWTALPSSGVQGVTGVSPITVNNTDPANPIISVNTGTTSGKGALQVGTNIDVAAGVISVKTGSAADLGVVQVGTNIDVAAGVVSVKTGSAADLGVLQVGTNVDVAAGVISVADSSTSQKGVVQLNDTTNSTSTTLALTAAQGKNLQDQIDALVISGNLTLAGTLNATTGNLVTVTTEGTGQGFAVGSPLPSPAAGNTEFFVIATVGATSYTPPGGSPTLVHVGDWFLSDGTVWNFLDVGFQAPSASTTVEGVVYLATDAEVQAGTDTSNKAVNPSSLQSKVSDSISTTDSYSIASSTAVKSAYDLADLAMPKTGGIFTGNVNMSAGTTLSFDSSSVLNFDSGSAISGYLLLDGASAINIQGALYVEGSASLNINAGATVNNSGNNLFLSGSNVYFDSGCGLNIDTTATFSVSPVWSPGVYAAPAVQVSYDNATSGLTATDVQGAIDEVASTSVDALPKSGGTMTGDITFSGAGNGVVFQDASTVEAISDSTSTTSSTTAASATAVKSAYDLANAAIPDSTFTAAGELIVGTGAGTYAPLSDGSAYQILTTDGAGVLSWVNNTADGVQGITGTAPITIDNTDPANPIVEIDAATTSASGAVQLYDGVDSTSTSLAATANAVKIAYDKAIADPIASATVLFVNVTTGNNATGTRGTGLPYQTVTAALAAASEGDTIYIAPGTYAESITLSKGVNIVGTYTDQASASGPELRGNFAVSITGAGTQNWAVTNIRFTSNSAGNNTVTVSTNSFSSGGIGTFTNCLFEQYTLNDLTERCFFTSGTWTKSLYIRNCTFSGNVEFTSGAVDGTGSYVVVDNYYGTGGVALFFKITAGTVEVRDPSQAMPPVLQTGGTFVATNINSWGANSSVTTSIFGGTGFSYKGTSVGLGSSSIYLIGQGNSVVSGAIWGKLSVGSNVIYGFNNVLYDTSLATLSGVPYYAVAPNVNAVEISQVRPQWQQLTTSSVVSAANQLGVALDSTTGKVYTVTDFDAGQY